MADTHRCPARGCAVPVPNAMLACRAHWALVSPETKRRVYSTWRARCRRVRGAVQAHMRACDAAEAEMNAAIGQAEADGA